MFKVLALLALPWAALAGPLATATAPSVKIKNGTVVGSSKSNVESFLGIPFAQPPVGNLRLRPPQSIKKSFGTFDATKTPLACPQMLPSLNLTGLPAEVLSILQLIPLFHQNATDGEDCLTVNIQRPAGTTASDKLPVLFWIFGGGFEFGSTSMYDGTSWVQRGVDLDKPVIYVSVNYRLGGFGFLAGKELSAQKSTNLGLRDQRLGLQWVQENIAAFGGDPSKVTIWGESAGSISSFAHTVINGGDNTYKGKPLFRGAIMDSGSITPADLVTAPQAQAIYNAVVQQAGCSGKTDTLSCLRTVPYKTFLAAANSVPGILSYRSLDLSYLPRPDISDNFYAESPDASVKAGKFARVPVIIGDQEDEGTLFALTTANISTNAKFIQYFASYFPNNPNATQMVSELLSFYPDQPLLGQPAGSPFNTGGLNNLYAQFKRIAAVLGDSVFTLVRRVYLDALTSYGVKSWSYLNSYFHLLPILGTTHATDLIYTYSLLGYDNPLSVAIQRYYISFVTEQDPNALGTPAPMINWPEYTSAQPKLLNVLNVGYRLIDDTFRLNASNYLLAYSDKLRA